MEYCDCKEFSETLAKTDLLIHSLLEDDKELSDEVFLSKLQELRREHKKSLKIIEDLYNEKVVENQQQSLRRFKSSPSVDLDIDLFSYLNSQVRRAYADALKHVTFEDPSTTRTSDSNDLDDSIGGSFISDSYFPQDWDRMTIDDVIQSARSLLLDADEVEDQQDKLGSTWSPGVTVPKPFSMTLRRNMEQMKAKDSYSQKFIDKLLEAKKLELAGEASRPKFRATPAPPSTYLPLYDELLKKNERRREVLREYCKEMLEKKMKPFNLTKTSSLRAHSRRCRSMDNLHEAENQVQFKARPVPEEIIDSAVDTAMKEHEMQKMRNRKQRANELLRMAQLPPNMQMDKSEYRKALKDKRHKHQCFEHLSFSPKVHKGVPNFEALQQEFQRNLTQAKIKGSKTTVPHPFILQGPHVKQHKHSHEAHKQAVKRHHSAIQRRSRSWTGNINEQQQKLKETKKNTATILRSAAIKRQMEEMEDDDREAFKRFQIKNEIENQMKAQLRDKLIDDDIAREVQDKQRRESRKEASKGDKERHKQAMREMVKKLVERPSLLERQRALIAQQSAKTRYNKALKAAGVTANHFPEPAVLGDKEFDIQHDGGDQSPKYTIDDESYSTSRKSDSESDGGRSSSAASKKSSASAVSKKSSASKKSTSLSNASHRTKTISSKTIVITKETKTTEDVVISATDNVSSDVKQQEDASAAVDKENVADKAIEQTDKNETPYENNHQIEQHDRSPSFIKEDSRTDKRTSPKGGSVDDIFDD